jgi:hypothetical protein
VLGLSEEFGFVKLWATCLSLVGGVDDQRKKRATDSELRSWMAVIEARLYSLERALEIEGCKVWKLPGGDEYDKVKKLRVENRILSAEVSMLSVSQNLRIRLVD